MMHSCEVGCVGPPPAEGAALLLELGTLIIEGRTEPRLTARQRPAAVVVVDQTQQQQTLPTAGADGLDDVHRRVLAAKMLSMKNYQRAHAGKEEGTDIGDKGCDLKFNGSGTAAALRGQAEALWRHQEPLCIQVFLAPDCALCSHPLLLLERWTMSVYCKRSQIPPNYITSQWLLNAVRSQLHFSQISAWNAKLKNEQTTKARREQSPSERQRKLSRETCNYKKYEANCDEEDLLGQIDKDDGRKKNLNVVYNLKVPGDIYRTVDFKTEPVKHTFPITDIGSNVYLKVLLESLPRLDDIPMVRCNCNSSNPGTLKRRRSKDTLNSGLSEEVLASTLESCTLVEVNEACARANAYQDSIEKSLRRFDGLSDESKSRKFGATFSPDLGIINPDKGCSSGISRKFSAYSSPTNSATYANPNSRGSTPDHTDYKVSGLSCSTTNCEGPLHLTCKRKSNHLTDDPYHFQFDETNVQVPSESVVTNYVLVDDRMQTPCRQKGKHRCNCDDESDQGSQFKDSKGQNRNGRSPELFKSEEGRSDTETKPKVLDERRAKEIAKYLRRLRKEAKLKQLTESGQSSQENSECKPEEVLKERDKSRRKGICCSRHNDLISNKDRRGASVGNGCEGFCTGRDQNSSQHLSGQKSPIPEAQSFKNDEANSIIKVPKMGGNSKTSDSQPATSIPILQASRFDHLMRFGNYRNPVPFHGNLSTKDTHSSKEPECVCSSIGCDQMASVKTSNGDIPVVERTYTVGLNFSQNQSCQTEYSCHVVGSCNICNSDDNYRPTVKKMISSYTQTEDFRCDCGKPLLPKCLECNANPYNQEKEESGSYHTGMKRSRGSHNLAAINKSALLLEALERTSRLSECSQKEEVDSGIDAILNCDKDEDVIKEDNLSKNEVIENNCDSSFSDNYYERDKNKLCLNCENFSVNDELLSRSASVSSSTIVKKPQPTSGDDLKYDKTTNSFEKTPSRKGSFAGSLDKAIDFIRKPKLKRLMPIVDKIDKIVMERNEEKKKESLKNVTTSPYINSLNGNTNSALRLVEEYGEEPDEDFLYKDEDSGITYMTNTIQDPNFVSRSQKTFLGPKTEVNIHLDQTEERNIVVYEKGNIEEYMQKRVEVKHGEKHSFEDSEKNCGSCKHFRWDDDISNVITETPKKACDRQCSSKIGMTKSFTTYGSFDHSAVPSVSEMDKFRWRLDSAASMVFHSRTGLPLTSSPAPLRRGKSCFDYDSSINSVSGIKSALYGVSVADLETELCGQSWSPGSSPGSPLHWAPPSPPLLPQQPPPPPLPVVAFSFPPSAVSSVTTTPKIISKRNKFRHGTSSGLLGSFEESVLNGRLEPAATVAGFTAEIGASGAFCPPHLKLPVTVFFYSLGENTTSAPYLGHINLGRRGYNVPRAGTIQVTLFNPHGTVVKMFVVMYDMTDMPVNSRTFLRQRTLCVPAVPSKGQSNPDPRTLRYLIHLRFLTSKSGKVYLHTDIRIIVSRKADMDTAHSLNSVLALQDGQVTPPINSSDSRKKKTVETGVFEKRTKRNYIDKNPRVIRIFGGGDSDSIRDIKSRINRSEGCFELASYCKQNGVNNNIENDYKYFDNEDKTKLNGNNPFHNNKENISNGMATSDVTESRTRSGSLSKELSYELRSFTYGPDNPKYSPR